MTFTAIRPFRHGDRFADVGKMIGHHMPGDFTGRPGLGDDVLEVVPFRVAQEVLEVAGKPELYATLGLLGICLERRRQGLNQFSFHSCISRSSC